MACGNNQPQQSVQYGNQTANGQPPMSLVGGGTNAIPMQGQVQQPIEPQQMAQQAAAMPTPQAPVSQAVQNAQDMADAMKVMQNSGVFLTPQQRFAQQHPFLNMLGAGAQAFGQGLTHQPFATSNNEVQGSLQNTQAQNESQLISPTNMMNMMFMKQMMGGGQPTPTTKPTDFTDPKIMAQVIANAPKGSTHFSPTVGYTDDQGNPVK